MSKVERYFRSKVESKGLTIYYKSEDDKITISPHNPITSPLTMSIEKAQELISMLEELIAVVEKEKAKEAER